MKSKVMWFAILAATGLGLGKRNTQAQDLQLGTATPPRVLASADQSTDDQGRWLVTHQTLQGGLQQGVELIEIDNGHLKLSVIPTRGMSLYQVQCGDVTLGWNSPVKQIVHPQYVDLNDQGGLGWLAGFNEMMVRCGVAFAGHPGDDDDKLLTLHGRVGNLPADQVSVHVDPQPPYRIRVRGRVQEIRFKFGAFDLFTEVSTVPGSNSFQIADRLVNRSEYEQEYQIIYHSNFGPPLLEQGARFHAPVKTLMPFDAYAAKDLDSYHVFLGPTRDYGEQVYCATLFTDEQGRTAAMLENRDRSRGVAIDYSTATLPFFTLWKNTDTESDGYVTGLEPGTGYPYNRSVERAAGRVPRLGPGDEVEFDLNYTVLEDAKSVAGFRQQIDSIAAGRAPTMIPLTPPDNQSDHSPTPN